MASRTLSTDMQRIAIWQSLEIQEQLPASSPYTLNPHLRRVRVVIDHRRTTCKVFSYPTLFSSISNFCFSSSCNITSFLVTMPNFGETRYGLLSPLIKACHHFFFLSQMILSVYFSMCKSWLFLIHRLGPTREQPDIKEMVAGCALLDIAIVLATWSTSGYAMTGAVFLNDHW